MTYYDTQQQNFGHNWQFGPQQQWGGFGSQPYGGWANMAPMQGIGSFGLGQAAHGQQHGQYGGQPSIGAFGYGAGWSAQPQAWGPQWGGWQQRQLSPQDVNEVVRQLVPVLPQILAQAQAPQGAIGYAAFGQAPRQLSQQDVNEVVRQILPIVPQIVGTLQGQPPLQYAAMQGGLGLGQSGPGYPVQNFGAPFGAPPFQSAFGGPGAFGHGALGQQQRQLTPQDVADITRQLIGVIPQVIGNLQAFNQQRMN